MFADEERKEGRRTSLFINEEKDVKNDQAATCARLAYLSNNAVAFISILISSSLSMLSIMHPTRSRSSRLQGPLCIISCHDRPYGVFAIHPGAPADGFYYDGS